MKALRNLSNMMEERFEWRNRKPTPKLSKIIYRKLIFIFFIENRLTATKKKRNFSEKKFDPKMHPIYYEQ